MWVSTIFPIGWKLTILTYLSFYKQQTMQLSNTGNIMQIFKFVYVFCIFVLNNYTKIYATFFL